MTDAHTTTTVLAEPVPDRPRQVLDDGNLSSLKELSDVAACLMPLLASLNWHGEPRQVADALPHFADDLDVAAIRKVLANLGFATRPARLHLRDIDPRLTPCLFIAPNAPAMVVMEIGDGGATVFNGATGAVEQVVDGTPRGTAYFVMPATPADAPNSAASGPWLRPVVARFRRHILAMFGVTGLVSLFAVAPPLFVMAVYDQVVGTGAVNTLISLLLGIILLVGVEGALRVVRARMLAYVGARLDVILGDATFEQILHLPVSLTERATLGAQVSRLRQFEAVREFFTGPLGAILLELPFTVLYVGVIAAIAGWLALVPVVLIIILALIAVALRPVIRAGINESGAAASRRQNFLIEMISNMRHIKACGAEDTWRERHRNLSADAAMAGFHAGRMTFVIQAAAQALMLTAGTAALAFGTLLVLQGSLTVGGLIASMALTWRVLTPIQVGFLSLPRLEQIILGLRRVNQLMALQREREPGRRSARMRLFHGRIELVRVSLRYAANARPALFGVSCAINPGEITVLTGPSGSGKTTLLKLIASLYQPQAGAILIDGIDIRQLDAGELRDAIAYVPQAGHIFHGTVAQNLRLANPVASAEELERAAAAAGILDDIQALPDGFDTRINDQMQHRLSGGFKQRLALAQAYAKRAPVYLLDEPATTLDRRSDQALVEMLKQLRGKATVIMVTHRPSHIALADQVIHLDNGVVTAAGPEGQALLSRTAL